MDSSAKIDMINAYRQLQGVPLKLGKAIPEGVAAGVNSEFQAWVTSRIEEYLGNSPEAKAVNIPAAALSDEDINVLIALIDNVRSKQKLNSAAGGVQQPAAPGTIVGPRRVGEPNPRHRGNPNARPLVDSGPTRPRDPDPDGMKRRDGQAALLRELSAMDNGFDPDA